MIGGSPILYSDNERVTDSNLTCEIDTIVLFPVKLLRSEIALWCLFHWSCSIQSLGVYEGKKSHLIVAFFCFYEQFNREKTSALR